MRTFLAVDISDEVRNKVSLLIERWRDIDTKIKWVNPENIHITIYFFGEADEIALKKIEKIIKRSLVGIAPFTLKVEGILAFPSLRSPRVIWAGIKNESRELSALFSSVKDCIDKENLPVNIEDRKYKPHLTIGRAKHRPGHRIMQEIERKGSEKFGSFNVDRVILYRSTLTRSGPIYDRLNEFLFKG